MTLRLPRETLEFNFKMTIFVTLGSNVKFDSSKIAEICGLKILEIKWTFYSFLFEYNHVDEQGEFPTIIHNFFVRNETKHQIITTFDQNSKHFESQL